MPVVVVPVVAAAAAVLPVGAAAGVHPVVPALPVAAAGVGEEVAAVAAHPLTGHHHHRPLPVLVVPGGGGVLHRHRPVPLLPFLVRNGVRQLRLVHRCEQAMPRLVQAAHTFLPEPVTLLRVAVIVRPPPDGVLRLHPEVRTSLRLVYRHRKVCQIVLLLVIVHQLVVLMLPRSSILILLWSTTATVTFLLLVAGHILSPTITVLSMDICWVTWCRIAHTFIILTMDLIITDLTRRIIRRTFPTGTLILPQVHQVQ